MLDGICQSYHWSFDQAMRLTIPQIIMLNHAAWVNQERSDRRYKAKREREDKKSSGALKPEEIVMNGKAMSEMTSEELAAAVTIPW